MTGMAKHSRFRLDGLAARARKWQATAVAALILLIAAGLAAYAAAASYDTVSGLAAAHGVALPALNPVGIDGGLFGIITLDMALTWIGWPIWWLRLAARLFAAGTVAANASAGWPSPVGTGLRVAAPALFVIIVEAARTTLLRAKNAEERERRAAARKRHRADRIPATRWLLDFRGTFALWKRMRLWREPSYGKAVSMELERLAAIEKLAMRYGPAWREKAPADLAWMVTAGVRMAEALERVAALTAPQPVAAQPPVSDPTKRPKRPAATAANGRKSARPEDLTTEFRALKLLEDEPGLRKPRMGGELARRLEVSPATGRRLHSRLTAKDRPGEPLGERSPGRPDERSSERT